MAISTCSAGLVLYGVGFGIVVAPSTAAIMNALPKSQAGDGSAANQISRQIGGALGVAIVGSIYASVYQSQLVIPAGVPATQATQAMSSIGEAVSAAAQLNGASATALTANAADAATHGMQWGFAAAAVLTLVVLLVGGSILRHGSAPAIADTGHLDDPGV